MTKELLNGIIAALENKPSTNFSAEDVNRAAINAIFKECGISENPSARELRAVENTAFALIEEAVDAILPKKLENVFGEFAETRVFPRDAEVVFNIEKIGKNRAKLTIAKGARGGIYRAARLDNKYFSVPVEVRTVAVYVTLEELLLGTASLADLFSNILEGFEEEVYKSIFDALVSGSAVAGYNKITDGATPGSGNHNYDSNYNILTTKATLCEAIDMVIPYVKQYGIPTIFGSYSVLSSIYNPLANTMYPAGYPNAEDSSDMRRYGFVQVYKGTKVVELPNYLVDGSNDAWFFDNEYVFVMPSGVKPVKIAMKGELYIKRNEQAVGSEKWEAHKMMGVGLAMANNFAVIKVTD